MTMLTLLHVTLRSSNSCRDCKFWGTNQPVIPAVFRNMVDPMEVLWDNEPKRGREVVLTGNLL